MRNFAVKDRRHISCTETLMFLVEDKPSCSFTYDHLKMGIECKAAFAARWFFDCFFANVTYRSNHREESVRLVTTIKRVSIAGDELEDINTKIEWI